LTGEKEVQKDVMIFLTGVKEKGTKGYNDSLTGGEGERFKGYYL
jgi:hypothetical protein